MALNLNDKYAIIKKIGEGSFSEVLKVRDVQNGKFYAAKKLLKEYLNMEEVMSNCTELIAIRNLEYHPNVIGIVDVVFDEKKHCLSLISELFDMNMYDYIKNRKRCLSEVRVKNFTYQLVSGLLHLHQNGIFHRDIKPENILIKVNKRYKYDSRKFEVIQLADLGSVCHMSAAPPYSAYISTRWYRAPESLLTSGFYGAKIDIWALGCVFYEFITLNPLFPGENELDQLHKIHEILGVPSERVLAKFRFRNINYQFPSKKSIGLHRLVPQLSNDGLDVLRRCLQYVPDIRITALKLQNHCYFNDLRSTERKFTSRFSSSTPCLTTESNSSRSNAGNNSSNISARSGRTVTNFLKQPIDIKFSVARNSRLSSRSLDTQLSSSARAKPNVSRSKELENLKIKERLWDMNPGHTKSTIMKNMKNN